MTSLNLHVTITRTIIKEPGIKPISVKVKKGEVVWPRRWVELRLCSSMTAALDEMSGQQHAPATIYPRERPGTHLQEAGWAPGPIWTSGKSRPNREFF